MDAPLSPSSAGSSGSFEYIPADPLDNAMGKKRDKSVSDALRAQRGRFLIKSNIVKHALIPGTRAKTSAVWNFSILILSTSQELCVIYVNEV